MSNPITNEVLAQMARDIAQRSCEQPELLWEQAQQHFSCPTCGEDFEQHTFEQMENCLGYDKDEGSL